MINNVFTQFHLLELHILKYKTAKTDFPMCCMQKILKKNLKYVKITMNEKKPTPERSQICKYDFCAGDFIFYSSCNLCTIQNI